jgi:hypothetical protein
VTAAPWRRALLGGVRAGARLGLWQWGSCLVGGVARARRQIRCASCVLAGRCRGVIGVDSLGLVRMVLW